MHSGTGSCFLFHAHLPWLKSPGSWNDQGRWWFYECLAESYIPLTRVFLQAHQSDSRFRAVLSVSPTLLAMLKDDELRDGFLRYLTSRIELCDYEILRSTGRSERVQLMEWQRETYAMCLHTWNQWGMDLASQWKYLAQTGMLEIITTSTTHVLLPFLLDEPRQLEFQILGAVFALHKWIGEAPSGFWLPECGWHPSLEGYLRHAGIDWVLAENTSDQPKSPILTPGGLTIFQRDPHSARLIWDPDQGYPSAPDYREFHHDLAHELDPEFMGNYLPGNSNCGFSGIKPCALHKGRYQPATAAAVAFRHARNFLHQHLTTHQPAPDYPVLMPFDCELFGHWWFEGPQFLQNLIRLSDQQPPHGNAIRWIKPSQFLKSESHHIPILSESPNPSSWGQGQDFQYWINASNVQESFQVARDRHFFWDTIDRWILSQNPRSSADWLQFIHYFCAGYHHLILEESSDWLFMITAGKTPDYGRNQIQFHRAHLHLAMKALTDCPVESTMEAPPPYPGSDTGFPHCLPGNWLEVLLRLRQA